MVWETRGWAVDYPRATLMDKMASDAYAFIVVGDFEPGTEIGPIKTIVIQTTTGRTKEFYNAVGLIDAMMEHMNSLTDEQCVAWFPCPECGKPDGRHSKTCSKR